MRRRVALGLLLSTAGAGLLAACGVSQTPAQPAAATAAPKPAQTTAPPVATAATTPAPSATPPAAAAVKPTAQAGGQPRFGGTLRTGLTPDLANLEVHFILTSQYENLWLTMDRLIAYDDALVPQPRLAESWDFSSDAKQLKFNLRKNVQFHTGREFTSDDVKYNLLRVRDTKIGAGTFTNQSNWFATIEMPDKYTIVLKSEQPRPLVFDFFQYFNMIEKDTAEGPDSKSKLVGTGPFALVEWVQGDHLSLTKNTSYWQSGIPYLDNVQVSILRDQAAMLSQLEAGALDTMKSVPLRDVVRLKADPEYQALVHPNSGIIYVFGLNTLYPPLDNKKVRQALNYAVDRKRFTDAVMLGLGRMQELPWPPGSPAYDASKEMFYPFDLDKAKALLQEAGVGEFEMDIVMTQSTEGGSMAQIYQADLARIGVKLNIITTDSATWLDYVNNRKYNGVYWSTVTRANLLPGTMITSGRMSDPVQNNSGFKTDAYTQLTNDLVTEADPAKQKVIYSKLNDMLLDESFAYIVSTAPPTMVAHKRVRNLTTPSYGGFGYAEAWLDA
jgi:peptide/nickel transport system substrate-binding protein